MDLRATSTALDTVLFVVLVGASVAILAGANPLAPDSPHRLADETADVLATSTTTVEYARTASIPGVGAGGPDSITVDRRAHGTYAELLAAAVTADPTVGSDSLTDAGTDLEVEVVDATRRALPRADGRVQVRATWRPYPESTLGRSIVVGDDPPRDADVSVAVVTVASGFPNVSSRLETAAGYDAIARTVASGTIRGLFPADRTEDALSSEGPDRAIVADRYRAVAGTLEVSVSESLGAANVTGANAKLVDGLTPVVRDDLAVTFDSPAEATRAVSIDRVRIVVRTWSS